MKLKDVETIEDFEGRVEQIMDDYLFSFVGVDGLTREPTEEDQDSFCGEDIGWMYTRRAMKLIDRIKDRIRKVGERHFPGQDFEIITNYLIEP